MDSDYGAWKRRLSDAYMRGYRRGRMDAAKEKAKLGLLDKVRAWLAMFSRRARR